MYTTVRGSECRWCTIILYIQAARRACRVHIFSQSEINKLLFSADTGGKHKRSKIVGFISIFGFFGFQTLPQPATDEHLRHTQTAQMRACEKEREKKVFCSDGMRNTENETQSNSAYVL